VGADIERWSAGASTSILSAESRRDLVERASLTLDKQQAICLGGKSRLAFIGLFAAQPVAFR